MKKIYSNIPHSGSASSSDSTIEFFNNYYDRPIDVDNNVLISAKSFFEKRGFGKSAAETVAGIVLSQAKKDNLNPLQILDTLANLDNVQISGLVAEILNYNRFKTSNLGIFIKPLPSDEVQRNILA